MRIGHGYDVHRLAPELPLILGGVEISYEKGLVAHSDGDVLLHALMDALLGAAGLPDIGRLFPDDDERYLNIASSKLAQNVATRLEQSGWRLTNADITLIAQAPKLAPYIPQMRMNVAKYLGVGSDRINIKATTEEGLGLTGAGEGIACHAVCLLEERKKRCC